MCEFVSEEKISNFFIKTGYRSRPDIRYFDDNLIETEGIIHQPEVYDFARYLGHKLNCKYIIDVGCGQGNKLVKLYPDFHIIGIDYGKNIKYCKTKYDFGRWIECDLEQNKNLLIEKEILESSLVICSDTIEHLLNPTNLLVILKNLLEYASLCLISTPERDLVRGKDDFGPPQNLHHIREWNITEFEELLRFFGLNLEFIGLTVNNNKNYEKKTILAVTEKNLQNNLSNEKTKTPTKFEVVAIMTCYNEEDILIPSINHLLVQGIGVYLIDNWSTDNSYNIAKSLEGKLVGIERFPKEGPSEFYEWKKILERVEQVSSELKADWIIHHDVDEVRQSPWPNRNLRDSIYLVDRCGFNAIDHTLIAFPPTEENFVSGSDFETFFRYFEFGKNPGHFMQIKAWKNFGQSISLANSGGHSVEFDVRRVYPYKFLLKHYPIRTQKQGEKKVFIERKNRCNLEERTMGWHTHYDNIMEGHSFLQNSQNLILFDTSDFHTRYLVERLSGIGIIRENHS